MTTTWLADLRRLLRKFGTVPASMMPDPLPPAGGPVDVLVTHDEVNSQHGTGILVGKLFGTGASFVSIRSIDNFHGEQSFGMARFCLPQIGLPRAWISRMAQRWLAGTQVRRIVCIPFCPDEVFAALAVQELFQARLCIYIMDDHNVYDHVISDHTMKEALSKAVLRLAISPEMQAAYQKKYGCKFWLLPPLVNHPLIRTQSVDFATPPPRKGILIGNIWFQDWLDELLKTVRGSGIEIDWYCNALTPRGLEFDEAALAENGIHHHSPLPEEALAAILPSYAFAIIPSGTRRQSDAACAIANLSLPSRLSFILATSHTPVIVMGGAGGAAARFVERFEVGMACDYEARDFQRVVSAVTDPANRERMSRNAARLAPCFSDEGAAEWFWQAFEKTAPPDLRFEVPFSLDA